VNSERAKPGPKAAFGKGLVGWEHEWYWVFHYLVNGIPGGKRVEEIFESVRPPKGIGVPKALYEERVRYWIERTKGPDGWVRKRYPHNIEETPSEPRVWNNLKRARTVDQVRDAYRLSRIWLNPEKTGKPWVSELENHALEFLAGKKYRYPKSNRPSSERKRIVHFARVMAGVMTGISPARAVDLLRNMNHGAKCQCVSCRVERNEKLQKLINKHLGNSHSFTNGFNY
jgi:hypothetical protein